MAFQIYIYIEAIFSSKNPTLLQTSKDEFVSSLKIRRRTWHLQRLSTLLISNYGLSTPSDFFHALLTLMIIQLSSKSSKNTASQLLIFNCYNGKEFILTTSRAHLTP